MSPTANMVGPLVAGHLLGTFGAILVFIMVFSALSSSLDSLLAATSILIVEDIYRRHFRPDAGTRELRRATSVTILVLGVATWLLCLPKLSTLAEAAVFHRRIRRQHHLADRRRFVLAPHQSRGAVTAMLLGSAAGLYSYFAIGFYVAAVVGASLSMTIVLISTWLWPREFDWHTLHEPITHAEID